MGRRKSQSKTKRNRLTDHKHSSLAKKKEINSLCEKLFLLSSSPSYATQQWDNYIEITEILGKIQRLEETKAPLRRHEHIDKFVKWLKDNGANIDNISLAEFPGYDLGLKGEEKFPKNDLIFEIPENLMFNVRSAAPELIALEHDPLIQHMPQVALAVALLVEKYKENSFWKPYIDVLPVNYNTVLYTTAAEMKELKGSPTLENALKQCRNIARQYSYLNRTFTNNKNPVSVILCDVFTYEEYRWAVSTVMTRQNLIPNKDGLQPIHALTPMWDMCNHENGRITTDFNKTTHCCECYALRDFQTGEQIFISYGPRTNSDFFVHSGFVYPENEEDAFKLRLGISKADSLQKERIELLNKLNLQSVGEFLLKPGSEPISDSLLAFLRVFSMRKSELDHWLKSDKVFDLKHMDCALETVVEETMRKFLQTRLKLLIANYPTTLEEDLNLLETTLPTIKKFIIQLRASEKKILLGALEYVEQWIKA